MPQTFAATSAYQNPVYLVFLIFFVYLVYLHYCESQ